MQFSPVKKRPETTASADRWSYEYATAARRYPDNRIQLPEEGAVRVDLVLTIHKSESPLEEGYLWQVIAGPTVAGWPFGGHWPIKAPINTFDRLRSKRESLVTMVTMSAYQGQPVHTRIFTQDIDSAGTLNHAWEDLFGSDIVSDLVYPASRGTRAGKKGYALTFYHVPTPAPRLINVSGFRWPASKHVDKPGTLYGFVLSPKGDCLAWTSIEVVR